MTELRYLVEFKGADSIEGLVTVERLHNLNIG